MMGMGDLQRKHKIVDAPTGTSIDIYLVSVERLARYFDPNMKIVPPFLLI